MKRIGPGFYTDGKHSVSRIEMPEDDARRYYGRKHVSWWIFTIGTGRVDDTYPTKRQALEALREAQEETS